LDLIRPIIIIKDVNVKKRDQPFSPFSFQAAQDHVVFGEELYIDHTGVAAKYPKFVTEVNSWYAIERQPSPELTLRIWQKDIFDLLTTTAPKKRVIHWIWSVESGVGKNVLKDYMSAVMKNTFLAVQTLELHNIMHSYQPYHKVILVDMPRDQTDKQLNFLTGTLELLSNGGVVHSSKYETCSKLVDAHIVVISNQPPPTRRLPKRFIEYFIDGEHCHREDWTTVQITEKQRKEEEEEAKETLIVEKANAQVRLELHLKRLRDMHGLPGRLT